MFNIEVFFIFNLLFLMTSSQKLLLISSRLVSESSIYELVLSAFNLTGNSIVNVTFKAGNDEEQVATFDKLDGSLFVGKFSFNVSHTPENVFFLSLKHFNKSDNSCIEQTVQLVDIFRRPIVIITTDKPVYEASEKVKIRVFVVNREWLPIVVPSMDILIYDSRNETIQTFSKVQTSDFGIHESTFKIPKSPKFGEWKIVVLVFGCKKSHPFQVQQKTAVQLHVNLKKIVLDCYVCEERKRFEIIVKKPSDSFVIGTANIVARSKDNKILNIRRLCKRVMAGLNTFFTFIDDDFQRVIVYKFEVEFTEDVTGDTSMVKFEAERFYGNFDLEFEIVVELKESFEPNENLIVKFIRKQFDGEPVPLLDDYLIIFGCEDGFYKSANGRYNRRLFNGVAYLFIGNTELHRNCKKIEIEVTIDGDYILARGFSYASKDFDKNIKKPWINFYWNYEELRVESEQEMGELYMVIISSLGISQYKTFEEAKGMKEFRHLIKFPEKKLFEYVGMVYYIRSDTGEIVYAVNTLASEQYEDSWLRLKYSGKVNSVKNLDLTIISEIGSKVYLYVVDGLLPRPKHEVTQRVLFDEKFIHRDFYFEDLLSYDLGKVNAFVMDLFQEGAKCGTKEPVVNQKYFNLDRELDSPWIEIPNRKYFSDAAQLPVIDMIKGEVKIAIDIPRDSSSIRIYGYSVHRTKGIAYDEISISLPKELAVKIFVTESATAFKIIKVRYAVFNFLKSQVEVDVSVSIENAERIDEDIGEFNEINYLPNFWDFKWQLNQTSLSERKYFYILAKQAALVQIKITASFNGKKFTERKEIKISDCEACQENKFKVLVFPADYFKVTVVATDDSRDLSATINVTPSFLASPRVVIRIGFPIGYKYFKFEENQHIEEVLNNGEVVDFHVKDLKAGKLFSLRVKARKFEIVDDPGNLVIQIYNLNTRRLGNLNEQAIPSTQECEPLDIIRTR